jgi:iron complex outermembrane receptor protein
MVLLKLLNLNVITASVNVAPSFLDGYLKLNGNLKAMLAKSRYADSGVVGAAARFDPTQSVLIF